MSLHHVEGFQLVFGLDACKSKLFQSAELGLFKDVACTGCGRIAMFAVLYRTALGRPALVIRKSGHWHHRRFYCVRRSH